VKVHLRQIPPDGLHLEGEEDCLIPDLESEGVRCVAPMQYNIDIGVSEGSLWANGSLNQPVELTCVGCLEKLCTTSKFRRSRFILNFSVRKQSILDRSCGKTSC